ncbi:MAG TPA: hypothetical protein VM261_28855 [Kofleriaceae bacterium]|nr:hypothetical protein [Kofleriaceae bacterium]
MSKSDEATRAQARAQHAQLIATIKRAIATKVCPACKAQAFTGSETFKHSLTFRGGDGAMGGGQVYDVQGKCSACGLQYNEMDMR